MLTWILGYFWSLPRGVSPRLEWGHARALFSRAVAAVSRFPSRGSRDQGLSLEAFLRGFPTRLSHDAFPRGFPRVFPTGVSHVPPWCESILGLKVEAVQGKNVSLEWTETSGGIWGCGTTLEFLSYFLWTGSPLEMGRERREFFPDHAGKDPSSRARRRKRGSSGCGRDSRASSRVESGMSGNFLSCSKGVKDPLEVPEVRCD